MNQKKAQCEYKNKNANPVQHNVAVCADHKGVVENDGIQKAGLRPVFPGLVFIQGAHEQGVLRMAFYTASDGLFLLQNAMCHKQAVVMACMTFNAADLTEMQALVRQPVMLLKKVNFLPVGQQLEPVEIGMTVQTYVVIIGNGLPEILRIPDTDPV
jgi:hypothetical protein